jgi:TusA-related sulfurtransferase
VTADQEPDLVVDAVGKRCPLPVIDLARSIEGVAVGAVVALRSDDPAAAADVRAWCRMRNQEFVGERTEGGVAAYLVRRRA